MNQSMLVLSILAAVQALAPRLSAQQPPPKDWASELEDITLTDQIQAASKRVQDVAAAPVDVVVLRSAELKALGYRTLGEALGGIVGFRPWNNHGNQFIGTRGVAAVDDPNTRLLILLDGHALNTPSGGVFSNVGEDFGLPMELVDRIEVVRGPASCLYGNNAFQALVNVVSVDAAGTANSSYEGAVSGGTGGLSQLWAHGAFATGPVKTSLVLSGFQRTGATRDYPQLTTGSLPGKLDREENQSAVLRVQGGDWSFQGLALSRTQFLASAPFRTVIGQPAHYRTRRHSGDFRWEPTISDVHWTFRLYGDRNSFTSEGTLDSARSGGVGGNWAQYNPDYSLGAEVQARVQVTPTLGLTVGSEQARHHFDGFSQDGGPLGFIGTRVGYDIGNSYLEAQWRPARDWTFVAGFQVATLRVRYAENVTPLAVIEMEEDSIRHIAPRFSAVWGPVDGQVLKFVYGQGFRLPTILERYSTNFLTVLANPGLDPEVLENFQGIWSSKWNSRFRTQLVLGYYQAKDTIVSQGGVTTPVSFVNFGSNGKGKSVEGETTATLGRTEISGGFGWYSLTSRGTDADNLSPWNGVLKATHRLQNLSLAAEARYIEGRSARSTATDVPANWTLRASVRFERPHYWAQVSLEDLTNSQRHDLVGQEHLPITWMEGEGRAIRGTVGYRF